MQRRSFFGWVRGIFSKTGQPTNKEISLPEFMHHFLSRMSNSPKTSFRNFTSSPGDSIMIPPSGFRCDFDFYKIDPGKTLTHKEFDHLRESHDLNIKELDKTYSCRYLSCSFIPSGNHSGDLLLENCGPYNFADLPYRRLNCRTASEMSALVKGFIGDNECVFFHLSKVGEEFINDSLSVSRKGKHFRIIDSMVRDGMRCRVDSEGEATRIISIDMMVATRKPE